MFNSSNLNSLSSRLQRSFSTPNTQIVVSNNNYTRNSSFSINGINGVAVNNINRGDRVLLSRNSQGIWEGVSQNGASYQENRVTSERIVISRHGTPETRRQNNDFYVVWYKDVWGGGADSDPDYRGPTGIQIFISWFDTGTNYAMGIFIGNLVAFLSGKAILTFSNPHTIFSAWHGHEVKYYRTLTLRGQGFAKTWNSNMRPNFEGWPGGTTGIDIYQYVNGFFYFDMRFNTIKEYIG